MLRCDPDFRSLSGSPAPERRLVFEYDSIGRRVRKTVWNNRLDEQGNELSDVAYVYDGWNLIAELDANNANAVIRSHVWGLELSGSLLGGLGGLLAVNDSSTVNSQPSTHFVAYDGNGNITGLVKASDGAILASYEYGPFGETIRANGLMAAANPFHFSTEYQDNESDLTYYGAGYYAAASGSSIGRDRLGEGRGENLYNYGPP